MNGASPAHGPRDGSADDRPAKRRRVAIACQACRDRKSKCCGNMPVCTTCRQMSTDCTYPTALTKTDVLRQDVTAMIGGLEKRMGRIERLLMSLEARQGTEVPATPVSRQAARASSVSSGGGDGEIEINEDAFQAAPLQPDSASDGIGIVPLSTRDDCAFFGPSSNIAFLRLVSRSLAKFANSVGSGSISRATNIDPSREQNDLRILPVDSDHPGSYANSRTFRIPSDGKARQLISEFFIYCGNLHPYIHESRFMDTYNETRQYNFTKVRRSWLSLLYIVFAIASSTSPYDGGTLAHMSPESEAWYKLASDICLKLVFSECGVNLEVVQCLLLMSIYLQGTHSSMKTVFTHGIAVKIAYQLGLHSTEASKSADPVESEVRKRVWIGLVLLDRTLSMTFGRPTEIRDEYSSHERPKTCPDAAGRHIVAHDELTVPFLQATIDLYRILQHSIDTLFNGNCGSKTMFSLDLFAKVHTLEADLIRWTQTLPHQLQIIQADDLPSLEPNTDARIIFLKRQKTIITLRYLSTRILIHRPVLEGLLDVTTALDTDVQHYHTMRQASSYSITAEITSAIRLIRIVNHLLSGCRAGHQSLGAWWFSLYKVFNGSLAILGGLLVSRPRWGYPEILSKADHEAAIQALQQSVEVLDGLDVENRHSTVAMCRSYLRKLIRVADPILLASHASGRDATTLPSNNLSGYSSAFPSTPGLEGNPSMLSTPFQHSAFDVDLDNFLFPLNSQTFGSHLFDPWAGT